MSIKYGALGLRVDSHVPFSRSKQGRPVLYPFEKLRVGESFLIPLRHNSMKKYVLSRAFSQSWYWSRKLKRKFTASERQLARDGERGVRVWRMA